MKSLLVDRFTISSLWSRYAGQIEWTASPNSTGNNLVRWCDVRENSWSNHFTVLPACVLNELNDYLTWKRVWYIHIYESKLTKTDNTVREQWLTKGKWIKKKNVFFFSKITHCKFYFLNIIISNNKYNYILFFRIIINIAIKNLKYNFLTTLSLSKKIIISKSNKHGKHQFLLNISKSF